MTQRLPEKFGGVGIAVPVLQQVEGEKKKELPHLSSFSWKIESNEDKIEFSIIWATKGCCHVVCHLLHNHHLC